MLCLLAAIVGRRTENATEIDGFNVPQPCQALVQQLINKKARRLAVSEGQSSQPPAVGSGQRGSLPCHRREPWRAETRP